MSRCLKIIPPIYIYISIVYTNKLFRLAQRKKVDGKFGLFLVHVSEERSKRLHKRENGLRMILTEEVMMRKDASPERDGWFFLGYTSEATDR